MTSKHPVMVVHPSEKRDQLQYLDDVYQREKKSAHEWSLQHTLDAGSSVMFGDAIYTFVGEKTYVHRWKGASGGYRQVEPR